MPAWDANVASERTGRIGPDLDLASSTVAATTTPTPVRSTGMRSDACTSGPGLPGCRLVDGLSPKIRRPVGPPHLWLTALPGPGRDAPVGDQCDLRRIQWAPGIKSQIDGPDQRVRALIVLMRSPVIAARAIRRTRHRSPTPDLMGGFVVLAPRRTRPAPRPCRASLRTGRQTRRGRLS